MGYDGLIDPTQFPFRSEDMDVEALERAAGVLRELGSGVCGGADDLVASWSGLQPVYEGPEQELVWGLMRPVAGTAERLDGDLVAAADRLDELAAALGPLRSRLEDLEQRATAFRASAVDGVWAPVTEGADFTVTYGTQWGTIPWDQDTDTVARNEDLLLEHAKLVEEISAVSADCHNALMDLVAWAGDRHDVTAVQAEALLDRRVEYPWGTPVAEDRNVGESVGHGMYSFGWSIWAGVAGVMGGYDARMEEYRPGYRIELLAGMGNAFMSLGMTAATTFLSSRNPGLVRWVQSQLPQGAREWMGDRQVVATTAAGELVGVDVQAHLNGEDGLWRWREDGIATGTESVLNIGSMFVPSGGAASGALKTGSLGARLLRIATGAVDLVIPGASALTYGGIRVVSRLETALSRLDDIPAIHPNEAGVAAEVLDSADGVVVEQPVSDTLLADRTGDDLGTAADAGNVDVFSPNPATTTDVWVDRTEYATTVSVQKQARHVLGSPLYGGSKSYFLDPQDGQAVLDAFHDGSAEILGVNHGGQLVVRVEGITGYNNNPRWGYASQETSVFFIKGTVSPSVVPYNPSWTPKSPV